MKDIEYHFLKNNNINHFTSDIYHYTPPEGLLGILENDSLHFTNIYFLNDKSELRYTYNLILELLKELKTELNPNLYELIQKRAQYVTSKDFIKKESHVLFREDFYVMSFSTDSDSLALWNNYTKNLNKTGYNIKFSSTKLIKYLKKQYKNIFVEGSLVCYDTTQQKESLKNCIISYNQEYNSKKDQNIQYLENSLMYEFIIYSLFFKHSKFNIENEYRIIISNISHTQDKKLNFKINNGLFIPYLKYNLPKNKTIENRIIEEITISPVHDNELAIYSLNKLLNKTNYRFTQLSNSNIPLKF